MTEAERHLIDRCLEGDRDAFGELYDRYAGRLYHLAARMAGPGAEADDLLQDIFLLAWRKLSSFRGDAALGTWLHRLAVNCCLDHVRSRQGRASAQTDPFDEGDEAAPVASTPPLDTVARVDLERAIAGLPAGCRAVFVLHDVEGRDHREVATMLGISEGTSKSQVHKARLRLRAALGARQAVSTERTVQP